MSVFPDSKAAFYAKRDRWADLAQREDYKCPIDGTTIPYEERAIFFETGLCGWCAHQMRRDD